MFRGLAQSRRSIFSVPRFSLSINSSCSILSNVKFQRLDPTLILKKNLSTHSEAENVSKTSKKSGRVAAATNSLRRVAVEAERSRGVLRQRPNIALVDPRHNKTKEVTAYCAAEQYDIVRVKKILSAKNYTLDPSGTDLYPQVIHFRLNSGPSPRGNTFDAGGEPRDVFVFPSGTVVAWNVDEQTVRNLITETLLPAAQLPHKNMETEDLEYVEDADSAKSSVIGETIHLGLQHYPNILEASDKTVTLDQKKQHTNTESPNHIQHETNLVLTKVAFSSGLARSTKLATLESTLDQYFQSTRSIPTLLSSGSRLPFTRSFILRKTGELFTLRAQLNLYSELTDSLPDLFWDSRHELGLEGYFDQVGRALDVGIRIKVLNEKMNYAQDIAAVLRERLSEQHGLALEWLIIILISIEVGFEILSLWREKREKENPDSMQSLLRRYIEAELGKT